MIDVEMKFGAISQHDFVLDAPLNAWKFFSFTLSREALSYTEIFDSAFSTPARYVQEIFVRLCLSEKTSRQKTAKFVFNPLYETNELTTILVLNALKQLKSSEDLAVLVDNNGAPAGYVFPAWLKAEDFRFISLLSTVDGKVDADLLHRALLAKVVCIQIPHLCLNSALHNGFWYERNLDIYKWVAETAITVLKSNVTAEDRSAAERQRDAIPWTAVMPYHAGDVLFFSIAFNNINSHFSRIAVNKAYLDIVKSNSPSLLALPIDLPLANRDEEFRRGKVTFDDDYFRRFRDSLPGDSFYAYHRPSREYNVTKFHLIDHFGFALGSHPSSRTDLLFAKKRAPMATLPPPVPSRVLLHFDGGWPLKVYPPDQQEELIDLLYARGYSITVLAKDIQDHPKCKITSFKDYETLTELLRAQHILVGMDSFPAHYAAHVLGLPTICLFANTRPENSNATRAPNYVFLENGLHCRPCAGIAECPLYGVPYCRNFVSPEIVVEEVAKLLDASSAQSVALPRNTDISDIPCPPTPDSVRGKTKHLSLRHIRIKVAIASLAPSSLSYLRLLYREFVAAVRSEGFIWAGLRVFRFLRKVIKRKYTLAE